MLSSALSALSDRLDSKFLAAFWLPAFVAVLGGLGVVAAIVGQNTLEDWISDRDSFEQGVLVALIVLTITMIAFLLRALSRPILEIFAGLAFPRVIHEMLVRRQAENRDRLRERANARAAALAASSNSPISHSHVKEWVNRAYPLDHENVQPTRLGNVLATAVEHPRLAYEMDGIIWWPRLNQLAPDEFKDAIGSAQTPLSTLLNICVVMSLLGVIGSLLVWIVAGHFVAAVVMFVICLLIVVVSYHAAISQAAELGSLIRVGFDLYRHDILRQMDLDLPADADAERARWRDLTGQLLVGKADLLTANPPSSNPSPASAQPSAQPAPDNATALDAQSTEPAASAPDGSASATAASTPDTQPDPDAPAAEKPAIAGTAATTDSESTAPDSAAPAAKTAVPDQAAPAQ